MADVQTKPVTVNIIKAAVFAVIGIGLVLGAYFLEMKLFEKEEVIVDSLSAFDFDSENIIQNGGIVRFDPDSTPEAKVENSFLAAREYVFDLKAGRLWGNFNISDAKVNMLFANVVVIPDHAIFDLSIDSQKMTLAVYDGDVYLGFLKDPLDLIGYLDEYSDVFMNRMLVPRDTQVVVSLSKVDERLERLLYSKLVKEFKSSAIPSASTKDSWVLKNQKQDEKFIEASKQEYISEVIFRGLQGGDDFFDKIIFWLEENLTFIPDKKREKLFENLFVHLDNAIFHANVGDFDNMGLSLTDFDLELVTLPVAISGGEEYIAIFDSYIDDLSIFGPGDDLYMILSELLDRKFVGGRDSFEVVNAFWLDVYDGIDLDGKAAADALNNYYGYFDSYLRTIVDNEFERTYLTYENQLFDNLFFRYPNFYEDRYFAIKSVLEESLLELFSDGQLKQELEQFFVANKISFLKRLRRFFFDGEISVDEAREVLSRLIEESEEFLSQEKSDVAIFKFFETELEDIGSFWGYLNSPEYYTSTVYGQAHEERYRVYLDESQKIWSFVDLQRDLFGEEEVEVATVADASAEIRGVFRSFPEVNDLSLIDLNDAEQRFVEVTAVVGGYPIEAVYDRSGESLRDIYAYNDLISDRSVKIASLLPLLQNKFGALAEDELPVVDEELTVETNAQRVARNFIANRIAERGFIVDISQVEVLDEVNAVYRVTNIVLAQKDTIVLTFDYQASTETAVNLFMVIDGRPVVMDGDFTIAELRAVVLAEGDFSVVEGFEEEEEEKKEDLIHREASE